ncbi:MAG: D-glycerate dehydrogenase [Pseudomonadota bacterium]|nr:D-glycerate dehydrogenase [Pseudomonadota bacterium]
MKKPVVLVTRKLPKVTENRMQNLFNVRLNTSDRVMSFEEIIKRSEGASVVVPTVTDEINAGLVSALPSTVEIIANFGAGVNHIDLAATTQRNICVTNTPDVLTEDTADLTIALMLAAARRLPEGCQIVKEKLWGGWAPTFLLGTSLTNKKLGIIGLGKIGYAVAVRARCFGMQIYYHNRKPVSEFIMAKLDATYWPSLNKMLAEVDFLSINCPQTTETHHLLDAERLGKLQKHAIVINSARGGIIDEAELAERLEKGEIAAAGLDVFENEPEINEKLFNLKNVVLAPHLGSATNESRVAMGARVIENIISFVSGQVPKDKIY